MRGESYLPFEGLDNRDVLSRFFALFSLCRVPICPMAFPEADETLHEDAKRSRNISTLEDCEGRSCDSALTCQDQENAAGLRFESFVLY